MDRASLREWVTTGVENPIYVAPFVVDRDRQIKIIAITALILVSASILCTTTVRGLLTHFGYTFSMAASWPVIGAHCIPTVITMIVVCIACIVIFHFYFKDCTLTNVINKLTQNLINSMPQDETTQITKRHDLTLSLAWFLVQKMHCYSLHTEKFLVQIAMLVCLSNGLKESKRSEIHNKIFHEIFYKRICSKQLQDDALSKITLWYHTRGKLFTITPTMIRKDSPILPRVRFIEQFTVQDQIAKLIMQTISSILTLPASVNTLIVSYITETTLVGFKDTLYRFKARLLLEPSRKTEGIAVDAACLQSVRGIVDYLVQTGDFKNALLIVLGSHIHSVEHLLLTIDTLQSMCRRCERLGLEEREQSDLLITAYQHACILLKDKTELERKTGNALDKLLTLSFIPIDRFCKWLVGIAERLASDDSDLKEMLNDYSCAQYLQPQTPSDNTLLTQLLFEADALERTLFGDFVWEDVRKRIVAKLNVATEANRAS